MSSPRPSSRVRSAPGVRARRAGLVAAALALVTLAALGAGVGVDGAGAQGASSTTTTRPASTSSSAKASTSVATSAAPTTAATTAAPTTAAPTTTIETTTTASTTTTVATTSTLPPPPPVENARFPARLVAPVPPVEGGPELVVNAMYLAASEDAQAPDVVVHFRAPFALPASKYQVAVLVGDPNGQRARVSLVSTGAGAKPTGTVEIGDGKTWTASGPTQVQHDPSGFVVIRVPLAATPAGGAVWAEITEGASTGATVRTPFFDRAAFFGSADAGTLPASRFGRVNTPDGKAAPDVAALDVGPVVSVNQQKIYVKYDEAPPTALLGQPVQEAVDVVRIVPNFDTGGVVGDSIRINRTAGTAALFDGFGATPVDKSGDRSWIVRGPDGPPGATTLVFDLDAAAKQLGLTLDRDRTAVGLTRSFVLADGRIVTADGVLATAAWLDLAPPPLSATTGGTTPSSAATSTADADRPKIIAGAAAVAAVLLVLALVLVLRRRRRRREDAAVAATIARRAEAGDRIPWAKNDSQLTLEHDRVVIPGTAEHSLLPVADEPATTDAAPILNGSADAPPPDPEPGAGGAGVETAVATAVGSGVGTGGVAVVEAEPPPSVGHAGPVPWRSATSGSTPAVEARAPAVDATTLGPEIAASADAAGAAGAGAANAGAAAAGAAVAGAAGADAASGTGVDETTSGRGETAAGAATADEGAAGGPAAEERAVAGGAAATGSAGVAAPADADATSVAGATSTEASADAPAGTDATPGPGAEVPDGSSSVAVAPTGAAATGPPVVAPTVPVDRRRRRASGVVIAGPTVGDVVGPSPERRAAVVSTRAAEPSGAVDVVWAGAGAAAGGGESEGEAGPPDREEVLDADQIDPSDALAALDLDLGSFRQRFEGDEPAPSDRPD